MGVTMRRTCLLIAVLGLGVAGCMNQTGGVTASQARAAGDALGNGVEDSAAMYGPMVTTAVDTTCVTLGGDTTDPDGDAIPTSATLTYDCTAHALGYTGTLTGTLAVTDDQPSTLAWAFTGTADLHASLTGPAGGSITSDRTGSLVGSQGGALGPYALDRSLHVVTVFTGAVYGNSTTVTEDDGWTATFTPQATWTPGGVVVTGSLDAAGSWNVTVGGQTLTATLSTPTPLTVDPACETRITGGVVTASYPLDGGGTGTITVTWTGCGARTVAHTE